MACLGVICSKRYPLIALIPSYDLVDAILLYQRNLITKKYLSDLSLLTRKQGCLTEDLSSGYYFSVSNIIHEIPSIPSSTIKIQHRKKE